MVYLNDEHASAIYRNRSIGHARSHLGALHVVDGYRSRLRAVHRDGIAFDGKLHACLLLRSLDAGLIPVCHGHFRRRETTGQISIVHRLHTHGIAAGRQFLEHIEA